MNEQANTMGLFDIFSDKSAKALKAAGLQAQQQLYGAGNAAQNTFTRKPGGNMDLGSFLAGMIVGALCLAVYGLFIAR